MLPGGPWQSFLPNSGAEAVEAAVKLARVSTGRTPIIGFRYGFHGRTAQAMALTSAKHTIRSANEPLAGSADLQLDAAMSDAGVSYGATAETNVPAVAQALAAAGRGVAVVSDDARYGLHAVRIRPPGGAIELRVPLFGAWDGSHYAAAAIAELVDGLADYVQERYGLPEREQAADA